MSAPDQENDQTKFITHTIKHIFSYVQKSLLYWQMDSLNKFPFVSDKTNEIFFFVKIPINKGDYMLNKNELYEGRLDIMSFPENADKKNSSNKTVNNMVLAFKRIEHEKINEPNIENDLQNIQDYFAHAAHTKKEDQSKEKHPQAETLNIVFRVSFVVDKVKFSFHRFYVNPKENIVTKFCDWSVLSMIKFFLYNAEKDDDINKAYSHFATISLNKNMYSRNNISNANLFSLGQRMNLQMAYLIVDTCFMLGININNIVKINKTDKVQIFHLSIKPDDFLLEIEEFILLLNKHYDSIIKFNDKHKERCKKLLNEIKRNKKNKDQMKLLDEKRKELMAIKEEFEKIFILTGDLSKLQGMFMNIFPIKPDFQILNNKRNAEEAEKVKNTKNIHFEDVFGWKKYGSYLSSEEYIKYVFIDNDYDNYKDTLNITETFFKQYIAVKK